MNFFQNFSLRKLLYNKKFAVSLSVIVAFVFWLIITLDQNPERERSFSSVPITVSVQGTILAEQGIDVMDKDSLLKSASVTVSGPNYVVSSLKSDDFKIYADLSGVSKPGSYTISLSAVKNTTKSGFNIVEVSPATIQVDFDYYDTKKFEISARVDGVTTSEGLISNPPKVTNAGESTIEIRGPRSSIEKISSVVAYYEGDDVLDTTANFEGAIIIYDTAGNKLDLSKFDLPYTTVDISVPVFKEKTLKIVPTFTNLTSSSLEKYLLNNNIVSLSETEVTVYGQPEKVNSLTQVELAPIDITTISKDNYKINDVAIYLEDGVMLRSTFDTVDITFNLSNFQEKEITISSSNIDYGDTLAAGIRADFKKINIVIFGPSSTISSMSDKVLSQIKLKVDLKGKIAGEDSTQVYNIPYTVVCPENIIAWEISDTDNKTVQVSLSTK